MNPSALHSDDWFALRLQLSVTRHSLGWLTAANLVGVLLALFLLRPQWGEVLGEFSYGRWMPLHLNWHLYGWCSLPAVGVLLRRFLPPTETALLQAQWVLRLWSVALAIGGWSWLHGQTSGKLFLDWTGPSRIALLMALVALWLVLAWNYWCLKAVRHSRGRIVVIVESLLLAALGAVPGLLYWSSGRGVYPPVDPSTGGPTGASLLGSTLVIVVVIGLLPKALSLPSRKPRAERVYWGCFCFSSLLFATLHYAPPSHVDWRQILGLASLLAWAPLGAAYMRAFDWGIESQRWLWAISAWWALLILSGFISFLPGVLDHFKFTHALVAHAHLAMAGFLTSLNLLMLGNLKDHSPGVSQILGRRKPFVIWHGALLLHLIALSGLATAEIESAGRFVIDDASGWALVRLIAGLVMAAVSIHWSMHMCKAACPA